MPSSSQAIFEAALALPEAERTLLVERLLESLPTEPEALTDEELSDELERRSADFECGTADAISWSELIKEE